MWPAQVFAEGLTVLREMYGNATVPEPRESLRTNWGLDPFAWGAYSFPAVNQVRDCPAGDQDTPKTAVQR